MTIIHIIRRFLEKYLLNKMKTLTKYYEDLVLNPEPNCFCMLKPGFAEYKDEFEKLLNLQGWKIIAQCIKKFTRDEIEDFYLSPLNTECNNLGNTLEDILNCCDLTNELSFCYYEELYDWYVTYNEVKYIIEQCQEVFQKD